LWQFSLVTGGASGLYKTSDTTTAGPFNGRLYWTTLVSQYLKGICILLKQEIVSGSGIRWTISKSAPRPRQITTPASHHSVFYRPDSLPATHLTA